VARGDEYCLKGRQYALYAEIVGPTDIGRHRPRNDVEVAPGAEVNTRCGGYGNALHAASSKGNEQIVQMLLKAGADFDA
jgi:ankyrin repeat protein